MTLDLDRRKHGRDGEGIDMEEGHSDEQDLQQEAPAVEGDGTDMRVVLTTSTVGSVLAFAFQSRCS